MSKPEKTGEKSGDASGAAAVNQDFWPPPSEDVENWISEALRRASPNVTDETLGFWVGTVEGLFTAFVCVALWTMVVLSDRVGRKPVVLVSIAGAVVMSALFGTASTLLGFIVLRSLGGIFMGSQATLRAMLAESTDDTNSATAFALFSSMWQCGSLAAPVIGGLLAHPTRFVLFEDVRIFEEYPFLLPCLVSVFTAAIGVLLSVPYLHETRPVKGIDRSRYMPLGQEDDDNTPPPSPRPDGVRNILQSKGIKEVLHAWMWYMLSQATFESVSVVFASTQLEKGGLGMRTSEIGSALAVLAVGQTLSTIFLFPRLTRRYGAVRLAQLGIWGTPLTFMSMIPWQWAATANGPGTTRWILWGCMGICLCFRIPAVIAIQALEMYAAKAAPQRSMLASLNGMISLIGNAMYSIGPLASATIFSLSLSKSGSCLWAFLLYVLIGIACIWTTMRIKEVPKDDVDEGKVVP